MTETLWFKAPELSEPLARAARTLRTSRSALVRLALEQYLSTVELPAAVESLGDYRELPEGYHAGATRVYAGLAELGGGPVRSVDIAEHIGLHRGNVDRHLGRLRADGYVMRIEGKHYIVLASSLEATG
jgi:hypothetical protein